MNLGKDKNRKAKIVNTCIVVCMLAVVGCGLYYLFMAITGIGAPLIKVAEKGDLSEVKRLVETGSDIDKNDITGMTPLNGALLYDKDDVAEYLLSKGAKADDDSLFDAIADGNIDIIKDILDLGISAGKDCIAQYVYYNSGDGKWNEKIIDLLLKNGAEIDAYFIGINSDAYTALGFAIYKRNLDLVKYLVEKGANVNAPMKDGRTPLQLAEEGYRQMLGGPSLDIQYYTDIPPSETIADYLRKYGAK